MHAYSSAAPEAFAWLSVANLPLCLGASHHGVVASGRAPRLVAGGQWQWIESLETLSCTDEYMISCTSQHGNIRFWRQLTPLGRSGLGPGTRTWRRRATPG